MLFAVVGEYRLFCIVGKDADTGCRIAVDADDKGAGGLSVIDGRTRKGNIVIAADRHTYDIVGACGRFVIRHDHVRAVHGQAEHALFGITVDERAAADACTRRYGNIVIEFCIRICNSACAVQQFVFPCPGDIADGNGDRALPDGQGGGVGKGEGVVADGKGACRRAAERHLHGKGAARRGRNAVVVGGDGKCRSVQNGCERFAACKGAARRPCRAAGKDHRICCGGKVELCAVGGGICILCKGDGHRAGADGIHAVVCLLCAVAEVNVIVAVDDVALFRLRSKNVMTAHGEMAACVALDIQAVRLSIAGNDGALSVIRPARDRAELFRRRQSLQRVAVFARLIFDRHHDVAGEDGDRSCRVCRTRQGIVAVLRRKSGFRRICARIDHRAAALQGNGQRDRIRALFAVFPNIVFGGHFGKLIVAVVHEGRNIPHHRNGTGRNNHARRPRRRLGKVRVCRFRSYTICTGIDRRSSRLCFILSFCDLLFIIYGKIDPLLFAARRISTIYFINAGIAIVRFI